jgi:hypothetical protein
VARRFARLLLVLAGSTASVSLAVGLVSGNGVLRSLSFGFYLAGCATLVIGFALAGRGPFRAGKDEGHGSRSFTANEREDALADAAMLVLLGLVLLALGVLTDTRYPLV